MNDNSENANESEETSKMEPQTHVTGLEDNTHPLMSQTKRLAPRAALPMVERDETVSYVPWRIGLHLVEKNETLQIEIEDAVTLGRAGLDTFEYPHYNLTQFGAHSRGVSRVHARLAIHQNGVAIHDLSSTNGTLLNGYRLEPFTDVDIQNDDLIELGRLKIKVSFLNKQD